LIGKLEPDMVLSTCVLYLLMMYITVTKM
jgi:hypothetical protein